MADDINKDLKERFAQLPKVVQDAITSADVEKRLRALADTHKLHLDQWQQLENEVMLVLLGADAMANLQKNIKNEVGVSDEVAAALAKDISEGVFEPIRQELERELEHPDAQAKEDTGVEGMRTKILGGNQPAADSASSSQLLASSPPALEVKPPEIVAQTPPVAPATPPSPAPTEKAIRMPASGAYKPGEASAARKDVHDDPYRETPA